MKTKKIDYVERLINILDNITALRERNVQPGRGDWNTTSALDEAAAIIKEELAKLKKGEEPDLNTPF